MVPPSAALPGSVSVITITGAGAPEALVNDVLGPLGFGPVRVLDSLEELTVHMRTATPRLVIVPVPPKGMSPAFEAFAAELRRNPGTACIGTAEEKDADTLLAAMRAGVSEFLVAPVERPALEEAMQRLRTLPTATSGAQLVVVYSGKGGVGVSSVASGLAWALAHRPGRPKVALVDFTTAGAGLRVQLDLEPMYDISSVAAKSAELDRELLRSCMVEHAEGVSILVASEDLDAVDSLDSGAASTTLDLLKRDFDFVVVDADHHLTEQAVAALDAATRVLVVSELQVITLRSTQRTLALFARLGYSPDKVSVIMNRCSEQDRVSVADAERVLAQRIALRLPRDVAAVTDAVTFGKFIPQHSPKSPLSLALTQLAEFVASNGDAGSVQRIKVPASSSKLSRMFGRG